MYRTAATILLFSLLVVAPPVGVEAAPADDDPKVEIARSHNKLGNSYFEQGDFEAALAEYEAALQYIENAPLLINVALTKLKLGKVVEALEGLEIVKEKYPEAANSDLGKKLVALAESVFQASYSQLTIMGAPKGATVTVDGTTTWVADGGKKRLWLEKGTHTVTVSHPEYAPLESKVETLPGEIQSMTLAMQVKGADKGSLSITGATGASVFIDGALVGEIPLTGYEISTGSHLVKIKQGGELLLELPMDIPSDKPVTLAVKGSLTTAKKGSSRSLPGWLTLGGGLVLAATGGVLHALALNDFDASNGTMGEANATASATEKVSLVADADEQWDAGKAKGYAAYTLYGVGGVAVLTGIYLLVTDGPAPSTALQLDVLPTVGGAAATLSYQF